MTVVWRQQFLKLPAQFPVGQVSLCFDHCVILQLLCQFPGLLPTVNTGGGVNVVGYPPGYFSRGAMVCVALLGDLCAFISTTPTVLC